VALAARPIANVSVWILVATAIVAWLGMRGRAVEPVHVLPAIAVCVIGVAAFAAARIIGDGVGVRYDAFGIGVVVFAALAEEAFFRGYLHERLVAFDLRPVLVGAVTATLFALIHVPTYGLWVLPLDLAAGALLAWQREAARTWLVPAVTHAAANLMQLG